jgi:hypothetical protein
MAMRSVEVRLVGRKESSWVAVVLQRDYFVLELRAVRTRSLLCLLLEQMDSQSSTPVRKANFQTQEFEICWWRWSFVPGLMVVRRHLLGPLVKAYQMDLHFGLTQMVLRIRLEQKAYQKRKLDLVVMAGRSQTFGRGLMASQKWKSEGGQKVGRMLRAQKAVQRLRALTVVQRLRALTVVQRLRALMFDQMPKEQKVDRMLTGRRVHQTPHQMLERFAWAVCL